MLNFLKKKLSFLLYVIIRYAIQIKLFPYFRGMKKRFRGGILYISFFWKKKNKLTLEQILRVVKENQRKYRH